VSQRTFYTEAQRHKPTYEQMVVREGTRAAYPFKDHTHAFEKTVSRHGDYYRRTEVRSVLGAELLGSFCWKLLLGCLLPFLIFQLQVHFFCL